MNNNEKEFDQPVTTPNIEVPNQQPYTAPTQQQVYMPNSAEAQVPIQNFNPPSNKSKRKKLAVILLLFSIIFAAGVIAFLTFRANSNTKQQEANVANYVPESFSAVEPIIPEGWKIFKSEFNGSKYAFALPEGWKQSLSTYYDPSGCCTDSSFNSPDYEDSGSLSDFHLLSGAKITVALTISDVSLAEEFERQKINQYIVEPPQIVEYNGRKGVQFVSLFNEALVTKIPDGQYVARFDLLQPSGNRNNNETYVKIIESFHFLD